MIRRLAVVTTHPIQYYAPVFELITKRGIIDLKVYYSREQVEDKLDPGFQRKVKWDIALTEGYDHTFIEGDHEDDYKTFIGRIEEYEPDAILVYGWNPKWHFKIMRHFKGQIPVWFRGDSTLLDERPGIRRIARRLALKYIYRYIDKAFYVGSNNRAYFVKHGVPDRKLVFAPHAIENERFFSNDEIDYEKLAQEWKVELNVKANRVTVIFVGKFEPKKAVVFLVKSIQRFNEERNVPVNLILCGDGPLRDEIEILIGDDNNINIIGFQNQSKMPIVYRLGDLVCLPSSGPNETWGLAVNEALASGRMVLVSSKVGCAKDLVHDDNGYIFKSNDYLDLKRVLEMSILDIGRKNTSADQIKNTVRGWSFEAQAVAFETELMTIPV